MAKDTAPTGDELARMFRTTGGRARAANPQYVGVNGHGRIEVLAPLTEMSAAEALLHAAWLVRFADPEGVVFPKIFDEVRAASGA